MNYSQQVHLIVQFVEFEIVGGAEINVMDRFNVVDDLVLR
jgi:hypothetical protein